MNSEDDALAVAAAVSIRNLDLPPECYGIDVDAILRSVGILDEDEEVVEPKVSAAANCYQQEKLVSSGTNQTSEQEEEEEEETEDEEEEEEREEEKDEERYIAIDDFDCSLLEQDEESSSLANLQDTTLANLSFHLYAAETVAVAATAADKSVLGNPAYGHLPPLADLVKSLQGITTRHDHDLEDFHARTGREKTCLEKRFLRNLSFANSQIEQAALASSLLVNCSNRVLFPLPCDKTKTFAKMYHMLDALRRMSEEVKDKQRGKQVGPLGSEHSFDRFAGALGAEIDAFFNYGPFPAIIDLFKVTKRWFPATCPTFWEYKRAIRRYGEDWMHDARFHPKGLEFVRKHLTNSILEWPESSVPTKMPTSMHCAL